MLNDDDDSGLPDEAFDLVRRSPRRRRGPKHDPRLLANLEEVRQRADGHWHRVAQYPTEQGAHTRAFALRKNPEFGLFEFHASTIDVEEGYLSALFCKWKGVKGKPGRKASDSPPEPEGLRIIRGGRDAAEG